MIDDAISGKPSRHMVMMMEKSLWAPMEVASDGKVHSELEKWGPGPACQSRSRTHPNGPRPISDELENTFGSKDLGDVPHEFGL